MTLNKHYQSSNLSDKVLDIYEKAENLFVNNAERITKYLHRAVIVSSIVFFIQLGRSVDYVVSEIIRDNSSAPETALEQKLDVVRISDEEEKQKSLEWMFYSGMLMFGCYEIADFNERLRKRRYNASLSEDEQSPSGSQLQ